MKTSMNKWWEISIEELCRDTNGSYEERMSTAFDAKYGKYDYSNDLRRYCKDEFVAVMKGFSSDLEEETPLLICGANSGYEIPYLNKFALTALDLSATALLDLKESFPFAYTVKGTMDDLPFESNTFDGYVNLRAIQSVGLNIQNTLLEAKRVTKKKSKLLFSIPNGYLDEGKIVKGMLTGTEAVFDPLLPYQLAAEVENLFRQLGMTDIKTTEITSEIFIQAKSG